MKNGTFKAKAEIAIEQALTKRFGNTDHLQGGDEEYEFECLISCLIPLVDDAIIEKAIAEYKRIYS